MGGAVRRRSLLMERGYEEKHYTFRWPICLGGGRWLAAARGEETWAMRNQSQVYVFVCLKEVLFEYWRKEDWRNWPMAFERIFVLFYFVCVN